jgi:hypothetical protein
MYRFMHKHRYWFAALVVITAVALAYFQINDDDPSPLPDNGNQPIPQERAIAE